MASAVSPVSAFGALRRKHREMAGRVARLRALTPLAAHDAQALTRAVDAACEVAEMLEAVACLEDRMLFPCLARWLKEYGPAIEGVQSQRRRLERALGWFLRSAKHLILRRSSETAAQLESSSLAVVADFREWSQREQMALFDRCDSRLGPFASQWLLGLLEVCLARTAPRPVRA